MDMQEITRGKPVRNRFRPEEAGGSFRADDFLVLRFPVLPAELLHVLAASRAHDLPAVLKRYLPDPYLREALYLASPSLYGRICLWEKGDGTFNDLPKTIARYVLRMAYRATPFGTFSCVSGCTTGSASERTRITLPERHEMNRLVQLDATLLSRFAHLVHSNPTIRPTLRFAPNDTIFIKHDVLTFTAYQRNRRGKRMYRRVEVERSAYLDAVLDVARPGLTAAEIAEAVLPRFENEVTVEDLQAFVWELVDTQVLCSDQLTDITSDEPLRNFASQVPTESPFRGMLDDLIRNLEELCGSSAVEVPGGYERISACISGAGVRGDREHTTKVDLFAAGDLGIVGADILQAVERVVNLLVPISKKKTRLANFTKIFVDRFGESEVPLLLVGEELEALGFSDKDASTPELAYAVKSLRKHKPGSTRSDTSTLLDGLISAALNQVGDHYVDITALVDRHNLQSSHLGAGDATLVAWLALWRDSAAADDRPVLEVRSVGSQDPGRVMGRFANGIPAIAEYLKNTASSCSGLVAEIVHLPEDRLGNISSRPVTTDYEVRLRGGNSEVASRLALDDLMVSVVNERVRIRSDSLDREVTLRMSNAHAFDNADALPIYRFLNHVSNQDYTAEPISLRRHLPKAGFVPGMTYRGVVTARPTWFVSANVMRNLKESSRDRRINAFKELRESLALPDWVALVQGDNIIPYELDNEWMVEDLIRTMLRSDEVTFTDVYPRGMQPYLNSKTGTHFHEIQVALRARGNIQSVANGIVPVSYRRSVVPIWDRWAYFKIYVASHCQDAVLMQLRPVLDELVATSCAQGYFFVRYADDGGAHLRVRIESRRACALETVLPSLRPVFDELLRGRLIQDIKIDPYVRETSRYGGDEWCALCEEIFCIDSKALLEVLPEFNTNWSEAWRTAALGIDAMLRALGLESLAERKSFAVQAARDFDAEMKFASAERKKIGELFGKSTPLLVNGEPDPSIPGATPIMRTIAPIAAVWARAPVLPLRDAASNSRIYRIRWSLVHMRLNRIFNRDTRLQEAIVWEMLKRSYARELHSVPPSLTSMET